MCTLRAQVCPFEGALSVALQKGIQVFLGYTSLFPKTLYNDMDESETPRISDYTTEEEKNVTPA